MRKMHPVVVALSLLLCTIGAESKGPCLGHYPMSLRPFAGVYVPQCTPFGYFKVVQVHGSTGHAWCVNPETGAKVESSDVAPGAGKPQCGKCFFELAKYFGAGHVSIGRTKPQCDENGRFTAIQHSGSTGYSWCVNPETGEKIEGSDTAPTAGAPNCDVARAKRRAPSPPACAARQIQLRPPMVGAYIPQCTENGFFKVVQYHASTGYAWCVHPETGDQIQGTEVAPGAGQPQCGKCLYAVADFFAPGFDLMVGNSKPKCDANGLFAPLQRSASTGYSFCVDVETGEKIEGTEVGPGEGTANCEAGRGKRSVPGPCHAPGEGYRPMPGQYIPQCTPFGFFKVVQIHASTGHAWCVNPETGEKVEESDAAPGAGPPQCGKCFYALAKFYGSGFVLNPLGRVKPECDASGRFKPQQRSASTGYTWCVDVETGAKIKGSDVAPGAGQANCEAGRKKRQVAGPCHAVRFSLRPVGQYIPQCTVFGYYSVIQRHPSTGYAWCANPETGAKVDNSDTAPGAGEPQCGKCLFELLEYYSAGRVPIGRQYPQCDDQGRYKSLQQSASSGYSWCVNPETGEKVKGSAVDPATGKANC